ncbi:eryG, partial [Symbiodinium natans]
MLSPLNYLGLLVYFVVLLVCMVASYRQPAGPARRASSIGLIAVTWFYILHFSITYPWTSWYEEGLNLFDVAYADVIWGGASGIWGLSQQLLSWAIVATVWTIESPAYYQLFGLFGAMSGSYCLIPFSSEPAGKVPASLVAFTLLAFVSMWMLPHTSTLRGLSWWLWALHACLIVPKFFQWGPSVDRGALYLVLAILSFLTHITSSKSSWPQSDCQISISVDVLASSALTCAFAAQHVKVQELIVWALLVYLASPGFVLGCVCGFYQHGLRSKLVTLIQRSISQLAGSSQSGWMNLGYWQSTTDYAVACRQLAEAVTKEAALKEADHVLCVGCGRGAELSFISSRHSPQRVVGLDQEPQEASQLNGVEMKVGCAESFASGLDRFRRGEFTTILAIDSLYHFDKPAFFRECAKVLQISQPVTFTDVVLRPGAPSWIRLCLCAMDIRWSGHWTEEEYRARLQDAGFRVTSWKSLEPFVLRPCLPRVFAEHLDYVLVKAELSEVASRPTAAVIGSGMSGLIAAHLLQETHEVVIFEAGPKCGLVGLQQELAPGVAVDVPLRFMMPHYYHHLLGVIRALGIPVRAVPYNAAYQRGADMLMVTSTSWWGHVWQHLKYVPYLAKLMFIVFFCKELEDESFLEYMTRHDLHQHEAYRIYSLHLSWMLSCTYEQVNSTPAGVILGFIRASNPLVRMYQESGNIMRVYPTMRALQDALLKGKDLRLSCPVKPFGGSRVIEGQAFDVVVVATDAAAAGYLLGGEWKERLDKIHYQKGNIVVHKDPALMPPARADWRTFNIRADGADNTCQITVWLNKFWGRDDIEEDLFETWNPAVRPAENLTIKEVSLGRATYTKAMKELWPWIQGAQGREGFYVAGAFAVE